MAEAQPSAEETNEEPAVDIMPIATRCFEMMAAMASGAVDPQEMRRMMPRLAACFARNIKWDVPACALSGRGSFVELMGALGPVWQGITVTAARVISVTVQSTTVAVIRTMYTVHVSDDAGRMVQGSEGDMEVAVSVRFRRDRIAQWYQLFQKELLDRKRQLALAVSTEEGVCEEGQLDEPDYESDHGCEVLHLNE
jgi:hypothetical protein